MSTLKITYIILLSVCVICAIIATFSQYIPMIVERKAWKVWKKCYKDNNVVKTAESKYGVRYDWIDTDYYACIFNDDDNQYASIFEKNGSPVSHDKPVFCSYYTHHSKKLAKKLMASNR